MSRRRRPRGEATRRALLAASVVGCLGAQLVVLGHASAERTGPPPTPVPPAGSPSPFPQALATPDDALAVPTVGARAAILADLDEGQVMFAKGAENRLPIASLTKVMTTLIALERRDLGDTVVVSDDAVFAEDDYGATSTLGLRAGERRTVRELLDALMLQSANDAAVALAIDIAGSEQRFVQLMNARAGRLGLRRTVFFSPHGLDDRGRSTARDLVALTRAAYATPGFARIVASRIREIDAPRGAARRVQNRNALLWLYPGAIGTKTGFTAGAGFCLIATAERAGRRLVAVVLGSRVEPFSEAATLLEHGFEGFVEETFVVAGAGIGTLAIRGGVVAVEPARSIVSLVPTAGLARIRERIVVSPEAVFPPALGERVGTYEVSMPGVSLGTAPVIVSEVPPPPPAGTGSWWQRAADAVGRAMVETWRGLAG